MNFGVQLRELRVRVAHPLENGIRRQPQIRIDRLGALQPLIAQRDVD